MNKKRYLMEHENEGHRLSVKTESDNTIYALNNTDFYNLKNGMKVMDAGSGSGVVAEIMSESINEKSDVNIELTLVDQSEGRLAEAKERLEKNKNNSFKYICSDLDNINIPSNTYDYIFCRFVFEYLEDQVAVFKELLRTLKPGGKLVIGDLDYNCMTHYGMPVKLEQTFNKIFEQFAKLDMFDPYAGRKLYSYFYDNGLSNINVEMYPHHLFFGELKEPDRINWKYKVEQLVNISQDKQNNFNLNYEGFVEDFMSFLEDKRRFTYTPIILVSGTKK